MTDIKGSDSAPRITGRDMMRGFYEGSGAMDACKIGAEVEYALCRAGDLSAPLGDQAAGLHIAMKAAGTASSIEPPTSAIEIPSPPFPALGDDLAGVKALLDYLDKGTKALYNAASDAGLLLSPFGHLPHFAANDVNIVDIERYQRFFSPPRGDMQAFFRFFTSCMNIQVSVGYKDPDHLLRIVCMATALEPVIFLSTDSSCGFDKGTPIKHVQNIALKSKMGRNTGIPDFYYSARSGADLVDAHIDFTLHNKHAFTAFNFDGDIQRLPEGEWSAFSDLEARGAGAQNLTNYLQVQSQHWRRAINIATIMDGQGALVNHRAELCAFQNGLLHQRGSAVVLGYLIGFDEEFYEQTQALLYDFGIDLNDLSSCRDILEANFNAACWHNNHYADVSFGAGGLTMGDFVRRWSDIIEQAAAKAGLSAHIKPLLHIMRTCRPDWLVVREAFPSLEACKDYITTFPQRVAANPNYLSACVCLDEVL